MNTIVANLLMREAAKAQTDARPFKIVGSLLRRWLTRFSLRGAGGKLK
jgi:hypothetical protein